VAGDNKLVKKAKKAQGVVGKNNAPLLQVVVFVRLGKSMFSNRA